MGIWVLSRLVEGSSISHQAVQKRNGVILPASPLSHICHGAIDLAIYCVSWQRSWRCWQMRDVLGLLKPSFPVFLARPLQPHTPTHTNPFSTASPCQPFSFRNNLAPFTPEARNCELPSSTVEVLRRLLERLDSAVQHPVRHSSTIFEPRQAAFFDTSCLDIRRQQEHEQRHESRDAERPVVRGRTKKAL